MATRVVETETGRKNLIAFIEEMELPITVTVLKGNNRSIAQNRLQWLWLKQINEQLAEYSVEEYRGYSKLHFAVPILREDNEEFRDAYDRVLRPLPYELKLEAMMTPLDFPCTRLMTTKQKKEYLDMMYLHFTKLGCILSDPESQGLQL